jgi:3'-phosphoadenosine 5'-phosphosulfate sulfotransferase (PAPS reductase)/FAD synthetase
MPTQEELKALQGESLNRKILITQTRILEWYVRHEGQVYVSFSGGKDSTVLLHIARQCFSDIEAVFVDTGLEYPEIREFVKTFDNVITVKPKMQFKEVIEKYGYPVISKEVSQAIYGHRKGWKSMTDKFEKESFGVSKYNYLKNAPFEMSHMCCNVMKKQPAKQYEKTSNHKCMTGTMAEESQQRQTSWLIRGCNSFDSKRPMSNPMSFWTEQDVLHYIKEHNLPYCSVYGEVVNKADFIGQLSMEDVPTDLMMTGCQRTGCMFCMFGVHLEKEPNRFQKMKITHPKQYDYCIREENGMGLGKVLDFINVKY